MSYRPKQGQQYQCNGHGKQNQFQYMEYLFFCDRFYHSKSTSLFIGGLVSKAWSSSTKTGCICTTPTRPYKSCIKHCPFSKSLNRFWLFSSSLSRPKNSKVCLISLVSVERNANFKPMLFFRLSFDTSPEDCVTK